MCDLPAHMGRACIPTVSCAESNLDTTGATDGSMAAVTLALPSGLNCDHGSSWVFER